MVRGGAKPLRTWPFRHEGDAVSGDGRGDLGGAGMGSCGIDLPLPNRAWGVYVGAHRAYGIYIMPFWLKSHVSPRGAGEEYFCSTHPPNKNTKLGLLRKLRFLLFRAQEPLSLP